MTAGQDVEADKDYKKNTIWHYREISHYYYCKPKRGRKMKLPIHIFVKE